ncbi:hypothetical protein Pyn_20633 [Prunus yedoensis var. nudiflora]|uniref:Uncharacterized protein n=1 Tax=Prunus yedoensis var. nudiflora TaxID=2094558 RepID=A0A314UXY2_PRUYE|nr:hypothetical protein Pyn_20633 [Prunus yedoensis var. nudiflora]
MSGNLVQIGCIVILLYLNPVIEALHRRRPIKHKNVFAKPMPEEKIQLEFQLELVVNLKIALKPVEEPKIQLGLVTKLKIAPEFMAVAEQKTASGPVPESTIATEP